MMKIFLLSSMLMAVVFILSSCQRGSNTVLIPQANNRFGRIITLLGIRFA